VVFGLLVTDRSLAWLDDHHVDWDAPVGPGAEHAATTGR
jgi:hypothetical protein